MDRLRRANRLGAWLPLIRTSVREVVPHCYRCGEPALALPVVYDYSRRQLPNIVLRGATALACIDCDRWQVPFYPLERWHGVIGAVITAVGGGFDEEEYARFDEYLGVEDGDAGSRVLVARIERTPCSERDASLPSRVIRRGGGVRER